MGSDTVSIKRGLYKLAQIHPLNSHYKRKLQSDSGTLTWQRAYKTVSENSKSQVIETYARYHPVYVDNTHTHILNAKPTIMGAVI